MPTDINAIMEGIESLFHKEMKREVFSIGSNLNEPMITQVGPTNPRLPWQFEGNTPEELIFYLLGHIAANPSRLLNTESLRNTYTHLEHADSIDIAKVNRTPNSSKTFLLELLQHSKHEAQLRRERRHSIVPEVRKVFLLRGPRGCGKTFLINHVMSMYTGEILDRNSCIWVRIDLTDNFGGKCPDLRHWFFSKITQVIFRYYNKASTVVEIPISDDKHIAIESQLEQYIDSIAPQELRISIHERYKDMRRIFMETKDQKLTVETVPLLVAEKVFQLLYEKHYSFIFIIDGLDRLEATPEFQQRFDNILDSIHNIIHMDSNLAGTFLIALRDSSVNKVKNKLQQWAVTGVPIEFLEKEVCDVPFSDILVRRLEYVRTKVREVGDKKGWSLTSSFSDWPFHINEYLSTLLKEMNAGDINHLGTEIDNIFGHNHRAKVQFLQYSYDSYLWRKKHAKEYVLVERMCKGGFKYPVAPSYDFQTGRIVAYYTERIYDNIFLPNIFHFPYSPKKLWRQRGIGGTPILAGLRLIQILMAVEAMKADSVFSEIECGSVVDLLQSYFRYDQDIVNSLLLSFSEYEIVALDGIPFEASDIRSYSLKSFPKLKYVYDKLLTDVAYFNMCAMRIQVGDYYVRAKPIFIATSMEDLDFNTDKWSTFKIINAINLFRLVQTVNELERREVEGKMLRETYSREKEVLETAKNRFQLFAFCGKTGKDSIKGQLLGTLLEIRDSRDIEDLLNRPDLWP